MKNKKHGLTQQGSNIGVTWCHMVTSYMEVILEVITWWIQLWQSLPATHWISENRCFYHFFLSFWYHLCLSFFYHLFNHFFIVFLEFSWFPGFPLSFLQFDHFFIIFLSFFFIMFLSFFNRFFIVFLEFSWFPGFPLSFLQFDHFFIICLSCFYHLFIMFLSCSSSFSWFPGFPLSFLQFDNFLSCFYRFLDFQGFPFHFFNLIIFLSFFYRSFFSIFLIRTQRSLLLARVWLKLLIDGKASVHFRDTSKSKEAAPSVLGGHANEKGGWHLRFKIQGRPCIL